MGKLWDQYLAGRDAACGLGAQQLWAAQAAKFRPVNWERVAVAMEPFKPVVGEELGTQRLELTRESYEALKSAADAAAHESRRQRVYDAELLKLATDRHDRELGSLRAEVEQLRRDNELLVQLANDQREAHVAELAKLMASAAQTVVVAPDPAPEFPRRALTHQRQVVGLLTEKPA